jgi:hypothetical protein
MVVDPAAKAGEVWLRKYDTRGRGWVHDLVKDGTDDRGMWALSRVGLDRPKASTQSHDEADPLPQSQSAPAVYRVDVPPALYEYNAIMEATVKAFPEDHIDEQADRKAFFKRQVFDYNT